MPFWWCNHLVSSTRSHAWYGRDGVSLLQGAGPQPLQESKYKLNPQLEARGELPRILGGCCEPAPAVPSFLSRGCAMVCGQGRVFTFSSKWPFSSLSSPEQ